MSYVVPRNFRLLEEYDCAIGKEGKSLLSGKHSGLIHYGLDEDRGDNLMLHYWRATMIGPQGTNLGEFMYDLEIFVPDNYPQYPPQVRFKAPKINMPAVNNQGQVDLNRLNPNFSWRSNLNIADALMAVRENLCQNSVVKSSSGLQGTSY